MTAVTHRLRVYNADGRAPACQCGQPSDVRDLNTLTDYCLDCFVYFVHEPAQPGFEPAAALAAAQAAGHAVTTPARKAP